MKYSKTKLDRAKRDLYDATGGRCQNCGRSVPFDAWNFAHVKGRNVGTAIDAESGFVLVCRDLHTYQHTRAGNLKASPCVDHYLDLGGEAKGHRFWDVLLEKIVDKMEKN